MLMSLEAQLLVALSAWRSVPVWTVAFSGGLDSTVLLHLLVGLAQRQQLPPLRAIHIQHGLQVAAEAWPAHCQQVCDELGVPLLQHEVQVQPGASLEQAARDARYAAFAELLGADEVLLTAQHCDDQAETLLFRLLRGAGARGLAAMPASRPLGAGHLVRPLLAVSRAELEGYARSNGLGWVEDPSNCDERFSRNFLRRQVLPLLTQRWPQAVASMARSAAHLSEAQGLLDELAQADLTLMQPDSRFAWLSLPSLPLTSLLSLSAARQRNLLRHWLAPLTPMPDSDHWAGWTSLVNAAVDAAPIWRLARGELQRADGRLWWLSGPWLQPLPPIDLPLTTAARLSLPGNGHIYLLGQAPEGALQVRYRQGGEVLQLAGRGRRDLKRLLNEAGVPGFLRDRLPLLYQGEELLAVANVPQLSVAAPGNWQFVWQVPTNDQGLS
ncbi:MAG: tRNA lysidine(34) synthetase TilS [Pseudomonas sp.]|uniref:tRNA lysidine(34) synthetase TilS n=1 Tax=Pseudomonas sp. TaxID=306 RepID=UPI0027355BB2|nr:tRNA lysidine(34) synthetase TilS [Pseudomonas sp.]MDP3846579.1 tRNA lysidine(34) synthetase TilS [Pseudomonas sp.]